MPLYFQRRRIVAHGYLNTPPGRVYGQRHSLRGGAVRQDIVLVIELLTNMHTCQDIFKRERLSRVAVSTTCWSSLQCTQRIAHTSQSAAPFVIKMSSPSISISISKLFRPDLSGPWSNFCEGCLLELLPASSQYLAKRMDFCFFHFVLFFESGN